MSLATTEPVTVDVELETKVTYALRNLLRNQGSMRVTFRLACQDHAESKATLLLAVKGEMPSETPFKVEYVLQRLCRSGHIPTVLHEYLEPQRPRR